MITLPFFVLKSLRGQAAVVRISFIFMFTNYYRHFLILSSDKLFDCTEAVVHSFKIKVCFASTYVLFGCKGFMKLFLIVIYRLACKKKYTRKSRL